MKTVTVFLLWAAAAAAAPCLPAGPGPLRAGDLAPAYPVFEGRGEAIGPSPVPGGRRDFFPAEIRAIAARLGIAAEPVAGVCFEWVMSPPEPEEVLAAMRRNVPPGTRVELLEISRHPAPAGELVFARGGLRRGAGPALWRGSVSYAPGRSFAVWARVRLSVSRPAVVARAALPAGRPIEASGLALETREFYPFDEMPLETAVAAEGKTPRRTLPAGQVLKASLLAEALAIRRGETVSVEVEDGSARLAFRARAETSGRAGAPVRLLNPDNGNRFEAVAESTRKAVIHVDAASGRTYRSPSGGARGRGQEGKAR